MRRTFLLQYTLAIATLVLARLLVGVLVRRYHVRRPDALAFLRRAAATALMVLVIKLDPSSEHSILAQDKSTPQAREAIKGAIETGKDQEDVPAVRGSPGARSPPSENVPVDFSVFQVSNPFLQLVK